MLKDVKWHPYPMDVFELHFAMAFAKAKIAKTLSEKSWWTRIVEELKLDFEGLW